VELTLITLTFGEQVKISVFAVSSASARRKPIVNYPVTALLRTLRRGCCEITVPLLWQLLLLRLRHRVLPC
jgi:hypothetical protein